ncbi:prepilin-type N-terminal cleavage/methylation domain-containing protein [Geminisphaera colitermitum]|uniref:prepilin-type N-terminal cleavage/methylation domain-containing protein n=1 Tax=Geminisphaera colitermitum TaxID=1148786 RepID=UPI000158D4A2|nr:prepilin-type N-terminal cleavage/methylation domain-containing protein [Geminisphaera colitermitum]
MIIYIHPPQTSARSTTSIGFTLIELLTVIAIIGVLAGILIPVVSRVRYTARTAQCASNLRQIFMAFELYAVDNKNNWPPVRIPSADQNFPYLLRDYIPMKSRYGGGVALNVFMCPQALLEHGKSGSSHYGVNKWLYKDASGTDHLDMPMPKSTIMTPSRTILLADTRLQSSGTLASSISNGDLPGTIQGTTPSDKRHANGSANIAYADGHVKFFHNTYQLAETKYRDKGADDLWSPDK